MNRKITISSCNECHHKDHKGAFGQIGYVPVCRASQKELPYTKSVSGNRIVATCTGIIPDWCPLANDS